MMLCLSWFIATPKVDAPATWSWLYQYNMISSNEIDVIWDFGCGNIVMETKYFLFFWVLKVTEQLSFLDSSGGVNEWSPQKSVFNIHQKHQ